MNGFIYDYPKEIQKALERAVDTETGEIIDERALEEIEALEMERDDKCASTAIWAKDLEAQADQIRKLADAYTDKAKKLEERAKKARSWVEVQLGGEKVKRPEVSIYYIPSRRVDILDEALIPDEYFKVVRSVKKTDISKALEANKIVPGTQLVKSTSMVIKTISKKG